jgi:sodium transport system permease protein
MILRGIGIVFRKEVRDNLRDRRSLALAFLYPLLGPILLGVLISLVGGITRLDPSQGFPLAIVGAERAPALIAHLVEQGVIVRPPPADPQGAVRRGLEGAVLVIPESFETRLAAGQAADLEVLVDSSRLAGLLAATRTVEAVNVFGRQEGAKRLSRHGLGPEAAQPLKVRTVNLATRANFADFFLFMVPPFLIFTLFIGGVYLAIDTTAGERERGSLEPLFANPLPRAGFMLGKYLAALFFTLVAVLVQLATFKLMFVSVGAGQGFAKVLGPGATLGTFAVAAPLAALAVAVQVIIATVSRSFKEAQTYLGLLPLAPAMPGLALVFLPLVPQGWMMAVPTFGQTLLFGQLVRGEPIAFGHALIASGVTLVLALVLLALAAKLYEREELIFGG